jgi:hypothetical protein
LAYDAARHETVMFGGYNATGYVRRTHAYDGTGWQLRDQMGPTQRGYFSMSYDAARAVTVLFGGDDAPDIRRDTWEWTGTGWNSVAFFGLTPRFLHAGAATSRGQDGRVRRHRHQRLRGHDHEWDGTDWLLRSTAGVDPGPSPRAAHAMAYDSFRGVTVLFGGDTGTNSGQTWEWNGTAGRIRADVGATPRSYHDGFRRRAGPHRSCSAARRATTAASRGRGMERPGPLRSAGDAGTPSPREAHAMSYDSGRGVVVLFGGLDGTGTSGQTWEWNGTGWSQRATGGASRRPARSRDGV